MSIQGGAAAVEGGHVRVGFLPRYGPEWGSSRVRVFAYVDWLRQQGVEVRTLVYGSRTTRRQQADFVGQSLRVARWADVLVLQKPVLPCWLLTALTGICPRCIVDVDDAVWVPPAPHPNAAQRSMHAELERRLTHVAARASVCTVGSAYLAGELARKVPGATTVVIPSSVDTDVLTPDRSAPAPTSQNGPMVVGWMGSTSNLRDLDLVAPALASLTRRGVIRVVLVTGDPGSWPVPDGWRLVPWTPEGERGWLRQFDVGIMPLHDDERSRGRCGFKAVQYFAAGLPVVASPVGGGQEILAGLAGLLASTDEEWVEALERLAGDVELRARLGEAGRRRAVEVFSTAVNGPRLLRVIEQAAAAKSPRA